MIKSLNVEYEGDTMHGVSRLPAVRDWESGTTKRRLKKRQRQYFNNMSLKMKNNFRTIARASNRVALR